MWYVVDGMDGCGKSSAADFIKEHLEAKGRRVLLITHPNRDIKVGRKEAAWLLKEGTFAKLVATQYYIRDVIHSVRIMKKNGKTRSTTMSSSSGTSWPSPISRGRWRSSPTSSSRSLSPHPM